MLATHSNTAPPVWRAPEGPEGTGGLRDDAPSHISDQAPPVWRAPEELVGLAAVPVGGGRARAGFEARGLAAVPVGGGRARAGLEIDHSERSSRVAISRAGRRPPAHTAARPRRQPVKTPATLLRRRAQGVPCS